MAPFPDAAILCGGLGTRLQGVLPGRPKALALVGGRPFLERLVDLLAGAGGGRIVLCIGVGGGLIRQHFQERAGIVFSEESSPLGTGGALGWARPCLQSDPVLAMNGDSLVTGLDWGVFVQSYDPEREAGAMVVVPQDDRGDAGTVGLDAAGWVRAFAEKRELASGGFHSAGIYLLSQKLLGMIPTQRPCSLEHEMLPLWLQAGMRGHVQAGPLVDIGTPERLARAQAEWERS